MYGHPRRPLSSYELHLVYRDPDYLDQFTLHPENDTEDELLGTLKKRSRSAHGSAEVRTFRYVTLCVLPGILASLFMMSEANAISWC